jgi:hypothetical protein
LIAVDRLGCIDREYGTINSVGSLFGFLVVPCQRILTSLGENPNWLALLAPRVRLACVSVVKFP